MSFTFAAFFAAATVVVCASARPISLVLRRFPGPVGTSSRTVHVNEGSCIHVDNPNFPMLITLDTTSQQLTSQHQLLQYSTDDCSEDPIIHVSDFGGAALINPRRAICSFKVEGSDVPAWVKLFGRSDESHNVPVSGAGICHRTCGSLPWMKYPQRVEIEGNHQIKMFPDSRCDTDPVLDVSSDMDLVQASRVSGSPVKSFKLITAPTL